MPSINDQVLALRKLGGFCRHQHLAIIEVAGADAAKFLQARLTNDAAALGEQQQQETCLLDGKGKIIARGTLCRKAEDRFWLLTGKQSVTALMAELNKTLFRERVELQVLGTSVLTGFYGGKVELLIRTRLVGKAALQSIADGRTGEQGVIVVDAPDAVTAEARELGMEEISEDAYEVATLENADPGYDLSGILMPETGLEQVAASYTKGCFPGQEVLARVRTYGATKRGLAALIATDAGSAESVQVSVLRQGFSPTLNAEVALAFAPRECIIPGNRIASAGEASARVYEVVAPPFYSRASRTSEAKSIYDAGLREFAGGSELKAIEMFRQAIELDPLFADAYESLGVTLSRNERLDEAIALMKQLAVLDPQSIMAHANLSVYYMQQGNKELAEEEKAVAMSIRMSQMAREMASQQKEEEERQQLKAAAEERMNMFRQVLAIDPDDFLANAGLGSVYIDLGQYENALPCLLKAIEKKPTHTVAYLALGQAYEKLDRVGEAIDIYKRGIQVAAQRGDGEPMKKMQKRLDVLATTAGS